MHDRIHKAREETEKVVRDLDGGTMLTHESYIRRLLRNQALLLAALDGTPLLSREPTVNPTKVKRWVEFLEAQGGDIIKLLNANVAAEKPKVKTVDPAAAITCPACGHRQNRVPAQNVYTCEKCGKEYRPFADKEGEESTS